MVSKNLLEPLPFIFHVSMWMLYFVWVGWGNVARYGMAHLSIVVCLIPVILGLVYLHRYGVRKLLVSRKKWKKILLWFGCLVIVIGSVFYVLLYKYPTGISKAILPDPDSQRMVDYLLDYLRFYLRFAVIGVCLALLEVVVNLFGEQLHRLQEKRRHVSARQKNVKFKKWVNHFLGNLTHGTARHLQKGTVAPQQVRASLALNAYGLRLLTRRTLLISLQEELFHLKQLAAMFTSSAIKLEVPTNTYQHQVIPLMLLSLYENMCKHGVVGAEMGDAFFRVAATPEELLIVARNSIGTEALWIYKEGGTGLTRLKELLEDNHSERVSLQYGIEEGQFELRLEIEYDIN